MFLRAFGQSLKLQSEGTLHFRSILHFVLKISSTNHNMHNLHLLTPKMKFLAFLFMLAAFAIAAPVASSSSTHFRLSVGAIHRHT